MKDAQSVKSNQILYFALSETQVKRKVHAKYVFDSDLYLAMCVTVSGT